MATISTTQYGNSNCPTVQLVVNEASSNETSVTYNWALKWVTYGYAVSSSVSRAYTAVIDGTTVASGNFAYGGKTTQNIATGTKTVSKTHAGRNITISASFNFTFKWGSTNGPGVQTASGTIWVPAKTSYTVSYNANNGSGAPGSQTKWYGENLTLSSTKPTRTGHNFVRWNTNTANNGTAYAPGATYSGNSALTLYAIWTPHTYTVSYNANGGSGAPGNQTKTYGKNLTLSSTKPTRTGHNFVRWNTNTANTGTGYAPGGTYSGNAALTLYAIWTPHTYTVSYNANGGTGAPGSQTKTYGQNLTLSSTKPTRTNYNFKGWATSSGGGVVYAPGATYSNNSAVTLYAVWELAYVQPRIKNFTAQRCTSDGTANESGTYIKVTYDWATDLTGASSYIDWKISTKTWTDGNYSNAAAFTNATAKSGSVSKVVGGGNVSIDSTYHVRIYVADSSGNTHSPNLTIHTQKFIMDIDKNNGIAFGKVLEKSNSFEVGWDVNLYKGLNLLNGPANCGKCRENTVENSYVKLFSFTMTAAYKTTHILFTVADTQSGKRSSLHNLSIHRSSGTTLSLVNFKLNQFYLNSGVNETIAVSIADSNRVDVYTKMNSNESPTVNILSMLRHRQEDAYGKIDLDCNTVVSSLPSGTQLKSS